MTGREPAMSVKDLISRYRTGGAGLKRESESTNRDAEPSESKNARKDKEKEHEKHAVGEYILRAAQPTTESLGFLRRMARDRTSNESDMERDDLMAIIRSTRIPDQDELETTKQQHKALTLIKKLQESDNSSDEDDCPPPIPDGPPPLSDEEQESENNNDKTHSEFQHTNIIDEKQEKSQTLDESEDKTKDSSDVEEEWELLTHDDVKNENKNTPEISSSSARSPIPNDDDDDNETEDDESPKFRKPSVESIVKNRNTSVASEENEYVKSRNSSVCSSVKSPMRSRVDSDTLKELELSLGQKSETEAKKESVSSTREELDERLLVEDLEIQETVKSESDTEFENRDSQDEVLEPEPEPEPEPSSPKRTTTHYNTSDSETHSFINGHSYVKKSSVSDTERDEDIPDVEICETSETTDVLNDTESTHLDLSVIEGTEHLNVDANKQRRYLAQKGSLANRRKPTRNSVRNSGGESLFDTPFASSSSVSDTIAEPVIMNGHYHEEVFSDGEASAPTENYDRTEEEIPEESPERSPGLVLHTGRQIPGVKMLPGLADLNRGKLRSVKTPTKEEYSPVKSTADGDETPSWLTNLQSKPRVLPPSLSKTSPKTTTQPETPSWLTSLHSKPRVLPLAVEKQKSIEEEEKPVWVKEALSKKRKVPVMPVKKKENETETPVAPWLKERLNRRNQSPSFATSSSINVSSNAAPEGEQAYLDTPDSSLISTAETDMESTYIPSSPQRKDLLSPLTKKPSIDLDEPMEHEDSKRKQTDLRTKQTLPPLERTPSVKSEETEESLPVWKREISERRKNKIFVPHQRSEQPVTLGEMPLWKKELAERSRLRKETPDRDLPESQRKDSEPKEAISPWQAELARRKMKHVTPKVLDPIDRPKPTEEVPDWIRQVQQRKQRIAANIKSKKNQKNEREA